MDNQGVQLKLVFTLLAACTIGFGALRAARFFSAPSFSAQVICDMLVAYLAIGGGVTILGIIASTS